MIEKIYFCSKRATRFSIRARLPVVMSVSGSRKIWPASDGDTPTAPRSVLGLTITQFPFNLDSRINRFGRREKGRVEAG